MSALVFMREARGDDAGLVPQGVTHALSHNLYYVALPDMRLTCARRCPHVHPEGTPPPRVAPAVEVVGPQRGLAASGRSIGGV